MNERGSWANPVRAVRVMFLDSFRGLERCLDDFWALFRVFVGLAVGWWVYVPLHELLHAAACVATGGEFAELQIAPLYGGAYLAALLPFVVSGGEYAGRLAGLDTGGSDLVYLATDFGPFLLTLFPGVFALRHAAAVGRAFRFGFWLPFALAPFLSLPGDAYEIGSVLVTRVPPWSAEVARTLLRGDDVFLQAQGLADAPSPPWAGFVLAIAVGLLWAAITYGLADRVARSLGLGVAGLRRTDENPDHPEG